jgi:hypothetical protein
MMSYTALISAPKGSADFPDKLLSVINGKALLQHTYESVQSSGIFDNIIVVTNDSDIQNLVIGFGGKVHMTTSAFHNTFESMAEATLLTDSDTFVCIPGAHLSLCKEAGEKLLQLFEGNFGKDIKVASIVKKIQDPERLNSLDVVKVALSLRMYGLYFSRAVIPAMKKQEPGFAHYEHINIVAVRKEVMLNLLQQPTSPLERAEQIDCLRFIENGVPIKMIIEKYPMVDIRTNDDIVAAETFLQN